ncbi:hypothetical protein KM043_006550 [Ampulex compressa]|nr:hypothetical protein KM043_006550 [Ampulex compressa]
MTSLGTTTARDCCQRNNRGGPVEGACPKNRRVHRQKAFGKRLIAGECPRRTKSAEDDSRSRGAITASPLALAGGPISAASDERTHGGVAAQLPDEKETSFSDMEEDVNSVENKGSLESANISQEKLGFTNFFRNAWRRIAGHTDKSRYGESTGSEDHLFQVRQGACKFTARTSGLVPRFQMHQNESTNRTLVPDSRFDRASNDTLLTIERKIAL